MSSTEPEEPVAEAKQQFDLNELGEVAVKKEKEEASAERWATEDVDQPWSIGEAIGVSMHAIRSYFFSLVLPVLLVELIGGCITPSRPQYPPQLRVLAMVISDRERLSSPLP